jgi:cysteine desulfurase
MAELPVYLDHAATALIDPEVAGAMAEWLGSASACGNASSVNHSYGRAAREYVERARAEVAALIGATPEAIVFTSGATEADNLAVLGAARAARERGRHIVTSRIEHRAVLGACAQLEREGFTVTYLSPDGEGVIEVAEVVRALRPDTVLVALMLVNNETGGVQNFAGLGAQLHERGVLLHVDAAQAAGRVPLDVERLDADLVALSSHKIHGPVGIGALYVRRRPRPVLVPLQFGGGQEGRLRPGTLPVHQIVGMGRAFALAGKHFETESRRLQQLRERLWAGLATLPDVHLNGHATRRAPHILNVSFEGVDGEALLAGIGELAVASGSACSSASAEPSYVLRALGRSDPLAQASLRFSLGRTTDANDIERAIAVVQREVRRLRELAPRTALGTTSA